MSGTQLCTYDISFHLKVLSFSHARLQHRTPDQHHLKWSTFRQHYSSDVSKNKLYNEIWSLPAAPGDHLAKSEAAGGRPLTQPRNRRRFSWIIFWCDHRGDKGRGETEGVYLPSQLGGTPQLDSWWLHRVHLLLYPRKISGMKTKILFPCYSICSAI